jgi:thioredoxin 1
MKTQTGVQLTDQNFDDVVLKSDQPVLVDFSAAWCPPCRAMAPAIEKLAEELAGKAVVATIDVDENPQTAHRFGITSMPTLLVFKEGRVVEQTIGARSLGALRSLMASHQTETDTATTTD